MPFVLAWVAELQAKIPEGTHQLYTAANNIVKLLQHHKHLGLQIHRHDLHDLAVFTWCDAAWASRPDGHSQGGHLTAVATSKAMDGEKAQFTVLDWGLEEVAVCCSVEPRRGGSRSWRCRRRAEHGAICDG